MGITMPNECPHCKARDMIGVQYGIGQPECYDGVSEWHCRECGKRFGRWSHKVLIAGEIERRYGVERI